MLESERSIELRRRIEVDDRSRDVIEPRARWEAEGALVGDAGLAHDRVVLQVSLDELEQRAIRVEEEGDPNAPFGVEWIEMERNPCVFQFDHHGSETRDLESDVAEATLKIVADPGRRHGMPDAIYFERGCDEVEHGFVCTGPADQRRPEESGIELHRAFDIGHVQQHAFNRHVDLPGEFAVSV